MHEYENTLRNIHRESINDFINQVVGIREIVMVTFILSVIVKLLLLRSMHIAYRYLYIANYIITMLALCMTFGIVNP